MLINISINKIALIERLDIEFNRGFSVFTGETGAGKSIILDALSLSLGGRFESRLLRSGEKQGSVTSEFDIKENYAVKGILNAQQLPCEDILIIRRVIYGDGRSRAFINDFSVSASLLKQIGENLVEIHGQHERESLLNPSFHMEMLDKFAALSEKVVEVNIEYHNWKDAERKLAKIKEDIEKTRKEEDYLRFVFEEISNLAPKHGEEEKLQEQRQKLMNIGKMQESVNLALAELSQNRTVPESLMAAQKILYRSKINDEKINKAMEALEKAAVEADEAMQLLEKSGNIDDSLGNLEQIEDRIFALKAASRKYNIPVSELNEFNEKISAQLELIDSTDKNLSKLHEDVDIKKSAYLKKAQKLSAERKKAAKILEKSIEEELSPLKMEGCKFRVEFFEIDEKSWSQDGIDKILFSVSMNQGSSFDALNKVASGGELSRFMLALKVILLGIRTLPTMIFDEIDTGIGGAVSDAVGKRLAVLGNKIQVFAITHQPQVAAYAKNHMLVTKQQKSGSTLTRIKMLSEKERREELARMLAGAKITEEARAAAETLMGEVG